MAGSRTTSFPPVPLALLVTVGAVLLWGAVFAGGVALSVAMTPRPEPACHPLFVSMPAGPAVDLALATRGRDTFERACAACHSSSGQGKAGLGKDLVRSNFVLLQEDAELAAFIKKGRAADDPANTTRVAMPPKGGHEALTDEDIASVVVYLRGMQDPRRLPALPEYVAAPVAPPSENEKAAALAAAGGDAELAGYIASGTKLFAATCAACHGAGGVGVKGNGKALVKNDFVRSLDDDGLLAFVKSGRLPSDPKNTTGVAMPPKGGNPALSDDDILDIISYLRTLQSDGARVATQTN